MKSVMLFLHYVFTITDTEFDKLKIQMILYYLYGHFLTRKITLFDDEIYVSDHKVSISSIEFGEMMDDGSNLDRKKLNETSLRDAKAFYEVFLDNESLQLLVQLIKLYSRYSGLDLRHKFHCEPLYNKVCSFDKSYIPQDQILAEFSRPYFEIERNLLKSIKDVRDFRRNLQSCSIPDIECLARFHLSKLECTVEIPFWNHQTKEEAFKCSLLFPIELEIPWDSLNFIYEDMRIQSLLAICVYFKSPLAMVHLSRILDLYFEKPKEIGVFRDALIGDFNKFFADYQKKIEKETPFFEVCQIYSLLNKDFSSIRSEGVKFDARCEFLSRNRDERILKDLANDYPEAYIYLAQSEKEESQKRQYYDMAGKFGVPFGWLRLGGMTSDHEKFVSCMVNASDAGITSAVLTLGEYYCDNDLDDLMVDLFNKFDGMPAVSRKLGKYYLDREDRKNSRHTYEKDTLTGCRSICILHPVEKDEEFRQYIQDMDDHLENCFMLIRKLTEGEVPTLKDMYPTEFEEYFSK